MYINLSNISNWVFENSNVLNTLKEDCNNSEGDQNGLYYIPFLKQYDSINNPFDFSQIFQKDNAYLNLDNYLSIYLDIFQFLDFICFEIPFYKLIEPKNYINITHILNENNILKEHFEKNIKGIQHHAFHLKKFNNDIHLFEKFNIDTHLFDYDDDFLLQTYDETKYNNDIDIYIKESIELDQYDWLIWFIKDVNNLNNYGHFLFNFDYSNVSLKTFDLLYNINQVFYPNICEYIVKYRKSEIFNKYIRYIKETYNDESLFRQVFHRRINEDLISHMEFVKLMLNYGYKFHFPYEYSKNIYYSNNPLLMNYMYQNYKEKIDKNVVDICHVIHCLSLNINICTYKEKCDILDFFITNYNWIFKMEKLLQFVFQILFSSSREERDPFSRKGSERTDNQLDNKNKYDFQFILTFIEKSGHNNNIYSYMLYLYFNYKIGIETYIESSKNNDTYDISKFKNTFKYVLTYKNVDYVNLYIIYKLYSNDDNLSNNLDYIKYATYDINIFKMLYKNKIGIIDLDDTIFMDAYQNSNINVILFMIENKYIPSKYVKNIISNDYNQHTRINQVEINGVVQIEKYYTNIQFENKEKIYKMICN